jgi:hypothetical protein
MLWLLVRMHLYARRILPSDYWTRFTHWFDNQGPGRTDIAVGSNANPAAGDVGNDSLTRGGIANENSDSGRMKWEKNSRRQNKVQRKVRLLV